MMTENKTIDFGDTVRVRDASATQKAGLVGLTGSVYGLTAPSSSNVEVIGELIEDYAINVFFEELKEGFWFTSDLLEFIDHSPGMEMGVGGKTWVRTDDGGWEETTNNVENKSFWERIIRPLFKR